MAATGLGLLLEEHRGDVVSAWRQRVQRDLRVNEPALAFAVAPLLREMSLALGGDGGERRSREAWARCAVLVRSTASGAQIAREFKLLHRCIWEALRARDVPVSPTDRTLCDEWLHDALAEALDRIDRLRSRVASFERAPVIVGPVAADTRVRRATPPPLPARAPPAPRERPAAAEVITDLEPLH